VLAGGRGWDEGVDPAVAEVPGGLTVVRPGYLPLEDLAPYLSGATVVAYPSLGEGFGLPVLEAMQTGVPVVGARCASVPEVAGDAGVLLDPLDTGAWRDAVGAVCQDGALRSRLREASLARAAQFSWARTAAETLASFRRAARERR